MTEAHITREESANRGRYRATIPGRDGEAELTYSVRQPGVISADHTFAPASLRGTGVAQALVERLVSDARAEGRKIVPLCSYVEAMFGRHPEWAELKAE